ncbi:hypothetical protein [Anaerocolumna jejuensis]|uniref:hypothetical protein n=1 Tax=Anaerocolumna jejuensis TaxID=259063 RepID=UPI003F7BC28C
MIEKSLTRIKEFSIAEKICLILGIASVLLYMSSFNYGDGRSLCAWSYEFWDALFDGKLLSFPNVTYENLRCAPHGMVINPIYSLPVAIWNFPFWCLARSIGVLDVTSGIFMVWNKMLYLIIFLFMMIRIADISNLINTNNKQNHRYIYLILLGSFELLLSLASAQDELIYVFLLVQSVYFYFSEKKILFYAFSILSCILCPLMLLPYLILIIFKDKNIISILSKVIVPLVPSYLVKILYSGRMQVKYGNASTDDFIGWFFGRSVIDTGWGQISILGIVILVVIVYAYFYKRENEDGRNFSHDVIFCIAVVLCAMESLGWDQYYRTFLWLPFVVLLIVNYNIENIHVNVFFVMVIGIIRAFMSSISRNYVLFSSGNISGILKNILGNDLNSVNGVFQGISIFSQLSSILATPMIGLMCILLYCNRNEKQKIKYQIDFPEQVMWIGYYLVPLGILLIFFYRLIG